MTSSNMVSSSSSSSSATSNGRISPPLDHHRYPERPLSSASDVLPFPVLRNIFSFLERKEKATAKDVCTRWRRVINSYNLLPFEMCSKDDIRETVLWTLYNRASEAVRPDGILKDPKAVEIKNSIDFDYEKAFGPAYSGQVIKCKIFDQAIIQFWKKHPLGTVVNLGEGMETQRFRLERHKHGQSKWITVDLPNAIFAREQFIIPDETHIHVPASVMDVKVWASAVPLDRPVFITAQGLLMYWPEQQVKCLFQAVAKWFPQCTLICDTICKSLSEKTMSGQLQWTEEYTVPKMPFGVNRFDAPDLFRSWVNEDIQVEEVPFPNYQVDGWRGYVAPFFNVPGIRAFSPKSIFQIKISPAVKKKHHSSKNNNNNKENVKTVRRHTSNTRRKTADRAKEELLLVLGEYDPQQQSDLHGRWPHEPSNYLATE